MTLIVAAIHDQSIWMVGDTAISGGTLELRERQYSPKIYSGKNFPALVAYAGGAEIGAEKALEATRAQSSDEALSLLTAATAGAAKFGEARHGGLQFAYACFSENTPVLYCVENGKSLKRRVLHIGSTPAFGLFQKIRHDEISPHAPDALKVFLFGSNASHVPEALSTAARSLIDLFGAREEHDVGGWVVPYILTPTNAYLCGYCYSVSDPVFREIKPGGLIPQGTAERGGASLSFAALPQDQGMVVYWPQLPGGFVYVLSDAGYEEHIFRGRPSEFKAEVFKKLSLNAELWAGDQPAEQPTAFEISRGENNEVDIVIAHHERGVSFAVHNLLTPFQYQSSLRLNAVGTQASVLPRELKLSKETETKLVVSVGGGTVSLSASQVDELLRNLAEFRMKMEPPVSNELSGLTMTALIDPPWRGVPRLHPTLCGPILNFRHSGFGWLGFVLPLHEAFNMGRWLQQTAEAYGHPPAPKTGGDS